MAGTDWVYLDGEFVPAGEALISPFDRGFLFAHAAYEVTAVYGGRLIDLELHLERLRHTLQGLELAAPDMDLVETHEEIVARNQLTEGVVYIQVSGGLHGPRDYAGPEALEPSVFMFTTPKRLIGDSARDGITAISCSDTRWTRRDLKTTQLVTQSLAYRAARRAGADTAILHENGVITEAASANLWLVTRDGALVTRDLSSALLPGITRARLIALLDQPDFSITEQAFTLDELFEAREAFTSSTGAVIAPVLSVDGQAIGSGTPGPVTRSVQAVYYRHLGADLSRLDWL